MTKIYMVRDREAGNPIDVFLSEADANKFIAKCEKEDKEDGIYTEDFYEVYVYQVM